MNRKLIGLLLWAGWFLASAVIYSLLRIASELLRTHTLSPSMAQDFAGAVIGVIALIVTLEITEAYDKQSAA